MTVFRDLRVVCHLLQPCVHPVRACGYSQPYFRQAVAWSTTLQSHPAVLRVVPFGSDCHLLNLSLAFCLGAF